MHNEETKKPTPRGPGAMNVVDSAKDFKGSVKRLFHELDKFKVLIFTAFVLAILGSIISILAPNRLSDLTDEISKGLVINEDNLKTLTEKIENSVSEDVLEKKLPEILAFDLSSESIAEVQMLDISDEDKALFMNALEKMQTGDTSDLSKLPDSVLEVVLPDSTYKGVKISSSDKIEFLKADKNKMNFPKSFQEVLFTPITIDGAEISKSSQYEFIVAMSTLDKDAAATDIYKKLDTLPDDIKDVIKPSMDFSVIKGIALLLLCMYLVSAICTYIQAICMTNVSNKFARSLRSKISTKINKLPLKYFDKHPIGDTLSRVTNDVDMIAQSMNQSLASLVSAITLFLGTIVMMFITNWILALTAIIASLLGFTGMIFILKRSQKYFSARQKELGNLNGHIEEIYSGLNVVKTYNGQREANEKFDLYNQKVYDANRKSQFLSGLMMPIMVFIGNFGYVAVCIVGALLTMNNVITFGVIVAFIVYVRLFTSPLSQIAQAFTSLQSSVAASERVFEFTDEKEMPDETNFKTKLSKEEIKGAISFKNVAFKYDDSEKLIIHNFTASADPGQKIAIVGPTGAGKTTMVNLLMKFYEINSGDIKIDGISIKELTRENIHDLFTMVLQDTWLFSGTIKENIVYNGKDITDEEVINVCKKVGLDHFIRTLPNGYDTIITEGSVSAGQRQLITIARGMLKNSPFLILDEATSNVDTRTEEIVQRAMDELMKGRTSFIIAHRLSTIKNADLILVLKDGDIIEQGTHEQLLEKNGFYANLYNSQFEI